MNKYYIGIIFILFTAVLWLGYNSWVQRNKLANVELAKQDDFLRLEVVKLMRENKAIKSDLKRLSSKLNTDSLEYEKLSKLYLKTKNTKREKIRYVHTATDSVFQANLTRYAEFAD